MGSLTLESTPGMGHLRDLSRCPWPSASGKRPLTGQVWWWFGEDEGLESVMARLGARLVRMEAHHWQQPLEGHLLAQENHLEQALGSDWLACLQRSNLKGIVLSPHEALRGDAWVVTPGGDWDNRPLSRSVAGNLPVTVQPAGEPVDGDGGEKLRGGCWWRMITPSTGHC